MAAPNFLRGALTDDNGLWDIAYISLAVVTGLLLFASLNMVALVWVDWATCAPRVILPTKDTPMAVTIISCKPDVLALGQAFGLAAGMFSTVLLALAAYMAATRKPSGSSSTTTTRVQETVVAAAPAIAATPAKPLPVVVKNQEPVAVHVKKPRKR